MRSKKNKKKKEWPFETLLFSPRFLLSLPLFTLHVLSALELAGVGAREVVGRGVGEAGESEEGEDEDDDGGHRGGEGMIDLSSISSSTPLVAAGAAGRSASAAEAAPVTASHHQRERERERPAGDLSRLRSRQKEKIRK